MRFPLLKTLKFACLLLAPLAVARPACAQFWPNPLPTLEDVTKIPTSFPSYDVAGNWVVCSIEPTKPYKMKVVGAKAKADGSWEQLTDKVYAFDEGEIEILATLEGSKVTEVGGKQVYNVTEELWVSMGQNLKLSLVRGMRPHPANTNPHDDLYIDGGCFIGFRRAGADGLDRSHPIYQLPRTWKGQLTDSLRFVLGNGDLWRYGLQEGSAAANSEVNSPEQKATLLKVFDGEDKLSSVLALDALLRGHNNGLLRFEELPLQFIIRDDYWQTGCNVYLLLDRLGDGERRKVTNTLINAIDTATDVNQLRGIAVGWHGLKSKYREIYNVQYSEDSPQKCQAQMESHLNARLKTMSPQSSILTLLPRTLR